MISIQLWRVPDYLSFGMLQKKGTIRPGFGFATTKLAALHEILATVPGEMFVGELQNAFKKKIDEGGLSRDELPSGFLDVLRSISPEMRVRDVRIIGAPAFETIVQ